MTEQLTHTWTFAIHKSVGLEMTSALKKCPGVGLGKRIQNRADFQEANFKSYNFTHSAYLYSRKQISCRAAINAENLVVLAILSLSVSDMPGGF